MEDDETISDGTRASAPAPEQYPLIGGRYRVRRVLGEGGMGTVYEAEHLALGKRVAVKVLHGTLSSQPEVATRFKREARTASAVESDHIVQVFDVGRDDEHGLFMVMELLKGQDLATFLGSRGALDPVTACGIVLQAAHALEKAHAAGIVHRDLKPANIFLSSRDDRGSTVKVLDFGIAKLVRDATEGSGRGLTRIGTAIGTPEYMSPEQAQGLPSVDHRSDMYSLGAVLFEAIAGVSAVPTLASYEQTIVHILTRPMPRLRDVVSGVPAKVDELVAHMMIADVHGRLQDMKQLRERILALFPELESARLVLDGDRSVSAPRVERASAPRRPATSTPVSIDVDDSEPPASGPAASRSARRRWGFFTIGVLGAVLLGGALVAVGVGGSRSSGEAATTLPSPAAPALPGAASPERAPDPAPRALPDEGLVVAPVGEVTATPSAQAPAATSAPPAKPAPSGSVSRPAARADRPKVPPAAEGAAPPTPAAASKPTQVGGMGMSSDF